MQCLECGGAFSTERIIGLEIWKDNHDGRPFAATNGNSLLCRRCFPTEAAQVRWLWCMTDWCRCLSVQEIGHFRLVFSSGRRSKPVSPFSVFPLAEAPVLTVDPAPNYEPHDWSEDD